MQWHLLKHGKEDFIQGETIVIGIETIMMGFCSEGESGLNSEYSIPTNGNL